MEPPQQVPDPSKGVLRPEKPVVRFGPRDLARDVLHHFAPLRVDPERTRRPIEAGGVEVIEEGMDGRRPRTGWSPHRVTDPRHRRGQAAAVEFLLAIHHAIMAARKGEPPALPCTPMADLALPSILAQSPSNPQEGLYQQLLQKRIVFLGSPIDDAVANLICTQLILLSAEDDKDIYLYVNSPGGSVTAGLAIYDTMQYVNCDVSTTCVGLAASMGQFLLCAGAPGKRYALPHSRILMHQPLGQFQGQAADIAIQAEQIMYLKRMMAERIAYHTGQPVERIEADSDRDRWFTAQEAKDYGFIDEVIEKERAAASSPAAP